MGRYICAQCEKDVTALVGADCYGGCSCGSYVAIDYGETSICFFDLPAWPDSDAQMVWDRFIAESNDQDNPNCPLWGYLVDLGCGG